MGNKRVDTARLTLKSLAVVAVVFALIGSIGCLVLISKFGNSTSSYDTSLYTISFVRYYDFARVSALILFGFAIVLATLVNAAGSAERGVYNIACH